MSRVALVPPSSDLGAALARHALVDPASAEVVVLDVAHDVVEPPGDVPRVVVAPQAYGEFPELQRRCVELVADAFAVGTRRLDDAIAWVLAETRADRTTGAPRLVVIGSLTDRHGRAYELPAGTIRIGRGHTLEGAGIYVQSSNVARHHAELQLEGGVVSIRDLRSTNGTLIVRRGEPARLVCPTGYRADAASETWLVRDRTADWIELRRGDELVLPGFCRLRLDG